MSKKQRWVVYFGENMDEIYRWGSASIVEVETAAEAVDVWKSIRKAERKNPAPAYIGAEPFEDSRIAEISMGSGFAFNAIRLQFLLARQVINTPKIGPRKLAPQVPAEVWNTKPVDIDTAWDAIKALCKGCD